MTRPYLLYVSTNRGTTETELFGAGRQFDVAVNDYTGSNDTPAAAEYRFSEDEWKFRHVHAKLGGIVDRYRAVGIFDDNIAIGTAQLNRLFQIGDALELALWQAALSPNSKDPWRHLFVVPDSLLRRCNVVEVMMPIFSREALRLCWDSFPRCYSAWGLDSAWPVILGRRPRAIVDAIVAKHLRPVRSQNRRMPNGMMPGEENSMILRQYGLRTHQDGMIWGRSVRAEAADNCRPLSQTKDSYANSNWRLASRRPLLPPGSLPRNVDGGRGPVGRR